MPANTSANSAGSLAPGLAPEPAEAPSPDPDLARVVAAWPELPAPIKAAVLALIGAGVPR
jgi:hypothetical protein